MNKWPDDELERQMIASYSSPSCAIHSIHSLLVRIRALEKHEAALTESLVEVLAGFRCLAAQYEGTRPYDAAIIAKAHKALEAVR